MHTRITLGALVLIAACGGKAQPSQAAKTGDMGAMPMKMGMTAPSDESAAILATAKDYQSWPKFPEMQSPTLSEGHKNKYVLGFYNQPVADAIASKSLPLPDGALIVKEERKTVDGEPSQITVMSKQGGAWYYIAAAPDGSQVMAVNGMPLEGDVAMCRDCHDAGSDNDFVLTHDFK